MSRYFPHTFNVAYSEFDTLFLLLYTLGIPYGCGSDQYSLWLWSVISIPYGCGQ